MRTTREEQYASHVHHFLAVSARYLGLAESAQLMPAREFDGPVRVPRGSREQANCCSRAA